MMPGLVLLCEVEHAVSEPLRSSAAEFKCRDTEAESLLNACQDHIENADALVIGAEMEDPVPILTALGKVNSDFPVFILRSPRARQHLVNRLRFAVGLGRHIRIWASGDTDSLMLELAAATHRRSSDAALSSGLAAAEIIGTKSNGFVLDEVLDVAPVGIVILDTEARVLALNGEAETLMGVSRASAQGRSFIDRFDVNSHAALSNLIADTVAGRASTVPLSFQIRRPSGSGMVDLHVSVGGIARDGVVTACAAYLDDVTELVQSKRELERARTELEEKVLLRTHALSEIKERLEDRTRELEKTNAQLEKTKADLELLTRKDALTDLYNRRYLDERLPEECNRARRQEFPVALMVVDIDHFKAYNDTYGHEAGDRCLCAVASVLQKSCRRTGEFAVRYGGEEFVLIFPGLDQQAVLARGENIRAAVEALGIEQSGDAKVITISVGGCSVSGDQLAAPDHLFSMADEAMYQAKAEGRNRVVIAEVANLEQG